MILGRILFVSRQVNDDCQLVPCPRYNKAGGIKLAYYTSAPSISDGERP